MHYTGTVYRNPYLPSESLLEVTQGCTHNKCKFCTMYKDVPFRVSSPEIVEEDLKELASNNSHVQHIQLVGANPLVLSFDRLDRILDMIHQYLPEIKGVYTWGRVTDLKNKTVDQLSILHEKGLDEISLGTESGDDWTLDRIDKGYHAADILEQCHKLDQTGIHYWVSFLNGVAGEEHSYQHAVNSARIFNQIHPTVVGTGGLTLFPGTPLLYEAQKGEFHPLSEKEMLEELKVFVENLDVDCTFITHHTVAMRLSGPDFLKNKENIVKALQYGIDHLDMDKLADRRLRTASL